MLRRSNTPAVSGTSPAPNARGTLEPFQEESTATVTYVCRVGHSYAPRELLVGKELSLEQCLWASLTTLDELIVLLGQLDQQADPATSSREYQARLQVAIAQRGVLEQVLARNEPVRLEEDIPLEPDPNASVQR